MATCFNPRFCKVTRETTGKGKFSKSPSYHILCPRVLKTSWDVQNVAQKKRGKFCCAYPPILGQATQDSYLVMATTIKLDQAVMATKVVAAEVQT